MRPQKTIVDGEHFFVKYSQYHKGFKVEYADMNVNGTNGVVKMVTGNIVKGLNQSITNAYNEEQALARAIELLGS
jgi:bacillolysin